MEQYREEDYPIVEPGVMPPPNIMGDWNEKSALEKVAIVAVGVPVVAAVVAVNAIGDFLFGGND